KYRRRFVDQLHDDELTVLDVAAATHGVQLVIAQQAGVLVLPGLPRSGLDPVHGSLPGFCHACPSSDPGAWFKALCCVTDVPTKATSGRAQAAVCLRPVARLRRAKGLRRAARSRRSGGP